MTDPYRVPGPVDAEPPPEPLPDRCVPAASVVCPLRVPPIVVSAPRTGIPPAFAAALSAAATLLLLMGSASLAAITWTVTSTLAAARSLTPHSTPEVARAPRAFPLPPPPRPALRRATPAPEPRPAPIPRPAPAAPAPVRWPASVLGSLGQPTHTPDVLWRRAERLAEETGVITLAHATLAPRAIRAVMRAPTVRLGRGGMRVLAAGPHTLEGLIGIHTGDLVTAIDGHPLDRPEGALDAYADLVAGRSVVVELVRAGKLVAIRIDSVG